MAKQKRFVIAFDNHGDMQDDEAVNAFFDFCKDWKPTIRIHGGDAFDLRCLRKGASAEEKQEGIKADVEAGVDFLKRLKPQVLLLGNHDYRLARYMIDGRDQMLREYCRLTWDGIMDNIGNCQIVPYGKRHGVYQLGNFRVIHGYHSGMYAARQAAALYGNVIMGHVHTPGYYRTPHIDGATGYTSGSLCQLEMDYNAAHPNTLRQGHGWIYGVVTPAGQTIPYAATKWGDGWHFPHVWRAA